MKRFVLAPMDTTIGGLTAIVCAIPLVLVAIAATTGQWGLILLALALAGVYAAVWLTLRPAAFEVDADELRIVFPTWTRHIPRADIDSTELLDQAGFRATYRYGLRIGAGGVFGGFGWLYTARGLLEFYISRTDEFLVVHRREGRSLLLTPNDPVTLAEALTGTSSGDG